MVDVRSPREFSGELLAPDNVPQALLAQHAGTARFAWNWALNQRLEALEQGEGMPGPQAT